MSKIIYLAILFIIDSHVWGLRIITFSSDTWLIVELCYLAMGFIYYGRFENFILFSKQLKYYWWWLGGIILSMIPVYMNYGQTLSQSIITYRSQLLLFVIPVLFKIHPTKEELIKSLTIYAICLWIIYVLREFNPLIISYDEETLRKIEKHGVSSLLLPDWTLIMFIVAYYLQTIKVSINLKSILIVFSCFALVFLLQNRSMLISITAIIAWTALSVKRGNKAFVIAIMLLLGVAVAYNTADTWMELFEETAEQIDDENYNRNKAYQYYLFEASPNWYSYIFGNGFLSAHVTSHMQDMMESGVYNSDVGFVGYWNQFGIIPIIIFFLILIPAAFKKQNSHFIRCSAIIILMCIPTSSYFAGYMRLHFCLFYYLYYLDWEEQEEQMAETEFIENVEIAEV